VIPAITLMNAAGLDRLRWVC